MNNNKTNKMYLFVFIWIVLFELISSPMLTNIFLGPWDFNHFSIQKDNEWLLKPLDENQQWNNRWQ